MPLIVSRIRWPKLQVPSSGMRDEPIPKKSIDIIDWVSLYQQLFAIFNSKHRWGLLYSCTPISLK